MLAQYTDFGCTSPDPYCIFNNVNFGYGLRDCSNGACGTDVASTVITFGSAYCSAASATHTGTVTTTGVAALPSCGQLCFNNMLAQYSALGCTSPDPKCVCSNVNFGYGLRDCSNGACGTDVASTVIAFGSSYCGSATASQTVSPTSTACQVVSGLASPVPSGAICGSKGTSFAATGAGTIIGYSAGSSYVGSLAACSAQCLATSCCTNIYFIQGQSCNLHYGSDGFHAIGNPLYDFYDAACFTCGKLSCNT
ncbi:hypothetical protein VE01_10444 [Pseudogymnoascus verrucosus]|uniref:Uncharacterized protein n=1 Tax=Pseudogymnoascus verrucosus TaxID=342668 RepID=A0A1B8G6U4_9PEZI|nr:uncharacterized protein VE01_10444 [Pseudogymnoascus verrucosus]OBT91548.1 hypothetical protein VE01_10444 [Pseudogymnoascus verrucosus]